jgi:uncharacterized protein with PQ loop repeat
MASFLPARRRSPPLFSFFFLPLFFFLWLFVGYTREELQKLRFSQIPTDLANKTSPFCWY